MIGCDDVRVSQPVASHLPALQQAMCNLFANKTEYEAVKDPIRAAVVQISTRGVAQDRWASGGFLDTVGTALVSQVRG